MATGGWTGPRRRPQIALGPKDPRTPVNKRQGLTPVEIDLVLRRQGFACAICLRPIDASTCYVDHDHALAALHGHAPERGCKRCIRGLLCPADNTLLGLVQDDVERLRRALVYLGGK